MGEVLAQRDVLSPTQVSIIKYAIKDAIDKLSIVKTGCRTKGTYLQNSCRKEYGQYLQKMDAEISNTIDSLKSFLEEARRYGTFQLLLSHTEATSPEDEQYLKLKMYAMSQAKLEYMREKLKQDTMAYEEYIVKTQSSFLQMEDNILDFEIDTKRIKRYVTTFERAKIYQNEYKLENEKNREIQNNKNFRLLLLQEEETSKTLGICYKTMLEKAEDQLEYWITRYEKKMEDFEVDKNMILREISDLRESVEYKSRLLEERNKLAEGFFKKRQKILSAKRIQRWWHLMQRVKNQKRKSSRNKLKQVKRRKFQIQLNSSFPKSLSHFQ